LIDVLHIITHYRLWDVHNITPIDSDVAAPAVLSSIATLTGHENNVCVLGINSDTNDVTTDSAPTAPCIVTGTTGFVHEGRITGAQLRWWKQSNTDDSNANNGSATQRYMTVMNPCEYET
jgi:hypothetical protein